MMSDSAQINLGIVRHSGAKAYLCEATLRERYAEQVSGRYQRDGEGGLSDLGALLFTRAGVVQSSAGNLREAGSFVSVMASLIYRAQGGGTDRKDRRNN
jgi:hypothetical protein